MKTHDRAAYGDWQTPPALADAVLAEVATMLAAPPEVVLEPTCGEGSFLVAASRRFPNARLIGYELNPRYAATARDRLPAARSRVEVADFFQVPWERALSGERGSILITGNPPWVTSADLGAMGSDNLPEKRNFKDLRGYDAITGKGNFDVSEWMILRLVEALAMRDATIAVLCKSAVARRIIEIAARPAAGVYPGALFRIDAMAHFNAAVDAVLLVARLGAEGAPDARWPVYPSLGARDPTARIGVVDGVLLADVDRYLATRHLAGASDPEWRSGIKHDCAKVMELSRDGDRWINGMGERVDIEDDLVFPLLKSSDIANDRVDPSRAVIVPQRALGDDTAALRDRAPRGWAYLSGHRALLEARKSAIYEGRPPFAIFGVGAYSFAPFKVAVSGLYKRISFALVPPRDGRPVMLDDTCYFLPFSDEARANTAFSALRSQPARDFLSARVFWDAKRPINKGALQALDLAALIAEIGAASARVSSEPRFR